MRSIVDDSGLAPYRLVAKHGELAREGLFVVEGRLVLPRLLASRYRVHSVLLSDAADASLGPMLDAHPDLDVRVAPAETIERVTSYDFHRGCLALAYRDAPPPLSTLLEPGRRRQGYGEPFVVLEGVSNPDNIGGIFRSAHAFGARGVVLDSSCGDPLYRKAIRTSMGATLDLPWTIATDLAEALNELRRRGCRTIALTPSRDAPELRDAIAGAGDSPIAFLLGSEGYGLSDAAVSLADARARIAMREPGADSLNIVAVASIALYEWSLRA